MFQIVYYSEKKLFIKASEIISKCFILNLLNLENFFYISEFITEKEH